MYRASCAQELLPCSVFLSVLLHGYGKQKKSIFAFHWRNHHRNARRYAMLDPDYRKPVWDWNSRGKEIAPIAAVVALHLPLASVAPWFTAALVYSGFNYLYKHKKCHTDIEWGKRHMPSHFDHHMGKNQDANWCVTRPWFDYVMGTRVKYSAAEHCTGWDEDSAPATAVAGAPQAQAGTALTPDAAQSAFTPALDAVNLGTVSHNDVSHNDVPHNDVPHNDVTHHLGAHNGQDDAECTPSKPPRAA
jgi:hypothetical protein